MIEVQDKASAIEETARIGVVDVKHGELPVPKRVLGHLADGPVTVQLLRAGTELGRCEAALTTNETHTFGKLTGISWPDDVTIGTRVTVMCAKGSASHDVAVLLPDLPKSNVDWPDADLPATPEPEPDAEPAQDDEPVETELADEEPVAERAGRGLAEIAQALGTSAADVRLGLRTYVDAKLAEQPSDETALPGPAEYTVPGTGVHATVERLLAGDEDAEWPVTGDLELPRWPGASDLAAGEITEVLHPVLVPAGPDPTEGEVEPGAVFSAALVAVRSQALVARQEPPRRAGWLERRVREAARLVLDRSWTATRVIVATASGLVLAGAGLGYLVQLAVTR